MIKNMSSSNHFNNITKNTGSHDSRPRVFCIILTTEKELNNQARRAYDSWVKYCDNHTFTSTLSTDITGLKENSGKQN